MLAHLHFHEWPADQAAPAGNANSKPALITQAAPNMTASFNKGHSHLHGDVFTAKTLEWKSVGLRDKTQSAT